MKFPITMGLLLLVCALQGCGRDRDQQVGTAPAQGDREIIVEPKPAEPAPPVVNPQRELRDTTIAQSTVGTVLLRDGYEFLKLTRDPKTSKLYANGKINGKTICLMIDTGASTTCIAETTATELRLAVKDSPVTVSSTGSERHKTKTAWIDDLRIGDLSKRSTDVTIVDLSVFQASEKEVGQIVPDGMLGADWLVQHSCVIDFPRGVLYYLDPAKKNQTSTSIASGLATARGNVDETVQQSPLGASLIREGYGYIKLIPDRYLSERFLVCTANGKIICLLIDTGAYQIEVADEIATELGLQVQIAPGKISGAGGLIQKRGAQIQEFKFGELLPFGAGVFVIDFTASRAEAKRAGSVVLDGLIGTLWLSNWSCVIDLKNDVLYLLDPQKRVRDTFNGNWQAITALRNGAADSPEKAKNWRLTIKGDLLELQDGETVWRCNYGIHSIQPNNQINVLAQSSSPTDRNKLFHGIYEFDESKNKLKLCLSLDGKEENRPTKMESLESNKSVLIEFERILMKPVTP